MSLSRLGDDPAAFELTRNQSRIFAAGVFLASPAFLAIGPIGNFLDSRRAQNDSNAKRSEEEAGLYIYGYR